MHPEQLLDAQADLAWRCEQPGFAAYLGIIVGGLQEQADSANLAGRHPGYRPGREGSLARILPGKLVESIKLASAYRVTADMCAVLTHAAGTLDASDRAHHNLAPEAWGFVRFETPLPVADARGRLMLAQWCTWLPIHDSAGDHGTIVCWFNDHHENPDDYATSIAASATTSEQRQLDAVVGRWGLLGVDVIPDGQTLGEPTMDLNSHIAAMIATEGDVPTAHTNTVRYLHALWLLLGQSVADVHSEHVRRTAVKLAHRRGLPGRDSVVAIRHTDDNARTEGESAIEWSRRWLVRGHWRWQSYGSRATAAHEHAFGEAEYEDGYSSRVCTVPGCGASMIRIWIHAHVKGPQDMPLVVPDKVYDLRR